MSKSALLISSYLYVGLFHPRYSHKDKIKLMISGYKTVKQCADMIE